MDTAVHLSITELEAGMEHIRQSPRENGVVKLIVRRPNVDERELVDQADFSLSDGLVGDNWKQRGSASTPDHSAHPEAQVTVMNARAAALMAQSDERWPLAGDQLFVDFDLSDDNIPAGTHIQLGSVVLEVSEKPHTGCNKFSARFGIEALKFVNSPEGKHLHLRGINTKVIQAGTIRLGDVVKKL
jgi:MOSC domain-containing protein YiiM